MGQNIKRNERLEAEDATQFISDKSNLNVKKTSKNKKLIKNEVNWYLTIPSDLNRLVPKVIKYDIKAQLPYIILEYNKDNDLRTLYVNQRFSVTRWNWIFRKIIANHKLMSKIRKGINRDLLREKLEEFYIHQTSKQIEELRDQKQFRYYFKTRIEINGRVYPGLNSVLSFLPQMVEKMLINIEYLGVSHGDYQLANMIYLWNGNSINMINPQYEKWKQGIYGDPRYDIGKLSQSILGRLDSIKLNDFKVRVSEAGMSYSFVRTAKQMQIESLFYTQICENYNIDEIKFIESLLTLSEVNAHSGNIKQKHIMLMSGIELFFEAVDEFRD